MSDLDLNALQVFDKMFKLGIKPNEFQKIEEEMKHKERTGLFIGCVKKGKFAICVLHDQKHQILIKEINELGDALRGVDFNNSRIIFKTLVKVNDLPEEIFVLHRIAQYRTEDDDIRYVAENLEELKDRICDRFADEYPKELGGASDYYRSYYHTDEDVAEMEKTRQELVAEQLKALFWLFGEDFEGFQTEMRKNIPRIVKVFSRNNRRVAIFQTNEDYERQRGGMMRERWTEQVKQTTLKLKTYTPRDERYDYVCEGREVFFGGYHHQEIWIDDDLFEGVGLAELEVLAERLHRDGQGEYIILNADRYNQLKSSIRLELMSAKRREQEKEARNRLVGKIREQFRKGKVIRQGIEFTRTSMSYGGVLFKAGRLGEFIVSQNIILQEQPNFTQIYQDYIDYILETDVQRNYYTDSVRTDIRFEGKTHISIGKVSLTLSKKINNFFVRLKGGKPYRIRKEDVSAVLKNAINHAENPQGYEEYLSYTSRVNLKLQKALAEGGMKFELSVGYSEDNALIKEGYEKILLTLPLTRRGGKNYVKIGRTEYRVKSTEALFDLGKTVSHYQECNLERTIKRLYRGLKDITPEVVGRVIQQGKIEYKRMAERIRRENEKKVKKSKEFLANAIRLTGARQIEGKGFLVRGISGMTYFVEDDGKVWTTKKDGDRFINDKYLCLIDVGTDGDGEWGRNDACAKRLLCLSKDQVVAGELSRNSHDAWWQEIER